METKIKVFIAYAHEDTDLKDKLFSHLNVPNVQELLDVWHDGEIKPGVEWESDIHENLEKADIVLLLISVSSLNSKYFLEKELKKILERHRSLKSVAIPVILRPCQWQFSDLADLQALPEGGKPVVGWPKEDEVLSEIAAKVKERAASVAEERSKKIQELELAFEKHLRDNQRIEAQFVLEKLKILLEHTGDPNGKIMDFTQRVAEVQKIQQLRDYLKTLEKVEKDKDWDVAKSLLDEQEGLRFTKEEIAASKNAELIKSLWANIEGTSDRIRRKSDAVSLDAKAEKAFVRKDYEEAKILWEQANHLENKSERINRARQCEERIRDREKVAKFEDALEQARKIRDDDPVKAYEWLEAAIQIVKDEKLELSEEGERVKERLKSARQELDEIKKNLGINQYANLLHIADNALDSEQYHVALNHFLTAYEINPDAREELEPKIQTCRLKLRVQQLRKAADDFEKNKDYIRAQGMYMALLQLSPEDGASKKKIEVIGQTLESIDKDYAQARAKGEKLLLQKQYEDAVKYFERCYAIKPDDNYVFAKKEEAEKKLKQHLSKESARNHLNTGKELFRNKQFREAKEQFSKALRYSPDSEEARKYRKFASQILWANGLFTLKLFSLAKRAYFNVSPEIRNLEFVEQQILQSAENQQKLQKNIFRYGVWSLIPLIVAVLGIWSYKAKRGAEYKSKQLDGFLFKADSLILQAEYSKVFDILDNATQYLQSGQDSNQFNLRTQIVSSLLAANNLEKQVRETNDIFLSITLQDSAINALNGVHATLKATLQDTIPNNLETLLSERAKQIKNHRDALVVTQNLNPLRDIISKGNTSFNRNNYNQTLSSYEKTSEYSHLIPLLSREERSQVRQKLDIIQRHYQSQSEAINPIITRKAEELGRTENYLLQRRRASNLRIELAGLRKTKSDHDFNATWAGRLKDRFN